MIPIIQDAPKGFIKPDKSHKSWRLHNGSSIKVGSMEAAHVDGLRGPNSPLIILEEGVALSSEDYMNAVAIVSPQQTRHKNSRLIHVTSAPDDPEHYLLTEVLPKCTLANTFFKRTIYQNTSLDEKQIQQIAAKMPGGINGERFRREYMCEIIKPAKRIAVPEWDKKYEVVWDIPKAFDTPKQMEVEATIWHLSIDLGGVVDKTAALLYTYDFKNQKVVFYDERIFEPNTNSQVIMAGIEEMCYGKTITHKWIDAPGQTRVDLYQLLGVESLGTPIKDTWSKDIHTGLNAFRVSVQDGEILVDPRCKVLIQTLHNQLLDKRGKDFMRTNALGHADALAAALYGYRNCDRTTNPYPERLINPDLQFSRPRPQTDKMAALDYVFGGTKKQYPKR